MRSLNLRRTLEFWECNPSSSKYIKSYKQTIYITCDYASTLQLNIVSLYLGQPKQIGDNKV